MFDLLLKTTLISSIFGLLGPSLYFMANKLGMIDLMDDTIAMLWPTWILGLLENQWGWKTIYISVFSNVLIFLIIGHLMAISRSKLASVLLLLSLFIVMVMFSKFMTNLDSFSLGLSTIILIVMWISIHRNVT